MRQSFGKIGGGGAAGSTAGGGARDTAGRRSVGGLFASFLRYLSLHHVNPPSSGHFQPTWNLFVLRSTYRSRDRVWPHTLGRHMEPNSTNDRAELRKQEPRSRNNGAELQRKWRRTETMPPRDNGTELRTQIVEPTSRNNGARFQNKIMEPDYRRSRAPTFENWSRAPNVYKMGAES